MSREEREEREERERRVADVVGAVARQALDDHRLRRVALLDDGSPEAELAARILTRALTEEGVLRVGVTKLQVESVLQSVGPDSGAGRVAGRAAADGGSDRTEAEVRRLRARLVADALVANPANKTALLLGGRLPPEPFLPLGDLYATEVRELAGGWSAPPDVGALVAEAGGIDRLDAVLRQLLERRDPAALEALEPGVRREVHARLAGGRAARVHPVLVPKLGARTLGIDLFE